MLMTAREARAAIKSAKVVYAAVDVAPDRVRSFRAVRVSKSLANEWLRGLERDAPVLARWDREAGGRLWLGGLRPAELEDL